MYGILIHCCNVFLCYMLVWLKTISDCFQSTIKVCSHMRRAVAEQRRADFDIPTSLPRVCSYICWSDAGGSAISWEQRWFGAHGFQADAENWVLDPFVAEQILLPLRLCSATAYVWTHVMTCIEANFPPASAPCMCERTLTVEGCQVCQPTAFNGPRDDKTW